MKLLVKVITWRLISIMLTTVIMYLFMQDVSKSVALSLTTHVVLVAANYLFELVWANRMENEE